jgi:hypothetical protein
LQNSGKVSRTPIRREYHRKCMNQLKAITPTVIYKNNFSPYFRIAFLSSNLINAMTTETINEKIIMEMK